MAKPKAAKTDPIKVTVLQPYLLTSMLAIGPNQRIFFSYTSVIKKKANTLWTKLSKYIRITGLILEV